MLDSRVIAEAEAAIAALDPSGPRDVVAADLAKIADWHRQAVEMAHQVEAGALALGRPGSLNDRIDAVRRDANRIADGFARGAVAFDRARRVVLAGAWPTRELIEVVRSHGDFADWLFHQLSALVQRAEEVTTHARAYYDRAFARVHADPGWTATVAEAFDADGNPRGARLADLPTDLDG